MFELKLNNKTIPLKWGTWAMREFCIAKNVTLDKYFEMLSAAQYDIDVIIKMVYIGYKSACVQNKTSFEYSEEDICEWIDEIGSIFNAEGQLIDYIKYIISVTVINVNNVNDKTEKKKPNKSKLG